ncbi:FkbM family methyltransferase [Oricola sp.]|uniref:FkbM family methyltransferase n=1 Tax=Oricola sp. TaxID=1979950 RepID=UPI003BAD4A76
MKSLFKYAFSASIAWRDNDGEGAPMSVGYQRIRRRYWKIRRMLRDRREPRKKRITAYIGDRTFLATTAFDAYIYLDCEDTCLTPSIIQQGKWQPSLTGFLERELRRCDHFVDVGANCGYFSLLGAKRVGWGGAVVAFEPQKRFAKLAQRSFDANFYNHAVLLQHALGEAEGECELRSFGTNLGATSLITGLGGESTGETARVRTLDDAIEDASRTLGKPLTPTVMKVDIEGYEPHMWRGMRKTLAAPELRLIVIEYSPRHYEAQGLDPDAFLDEIRSAGFNIAYLDSSSIELPLSHPTYEEALATWGQAELVLRKRNAA